MPYFAERRPIESVCGLERGYAVAGGEVVVGEKGEENRERAAVGEGQ